MFKIVRVNIVWLIVHVYLYFLIYHFSLHPCAKLLFFLRKIKGFIFLTQLSILFVSNNPNAHRHISLWGWHAITNKLLNWWHLSNWWHIALNLSFYQYIYLPTYLEDCCTFDFTEQNCLFYFTEQQVVVIWLNRLVLISLIRLVALYDWAD